MTHPFTIVAGSRTNRPPAPNRVADNETEVFTLPQYVIDALEKQCQHTDNRPGQDQLRQADRQPDLTKSKKPAT